ncbi:MAG: hypothetical protein ACJ74Z_23125 [Bryobacteraceae bacterium]
MLKRLQFLLLIGLIGLARGQNEASLGSRAAEFSAALIDGTLKVGTDCSERTPCNARSGNFVHSFKAAATIKPSGSSSGPVLVYIDGASDLMAGSNVKLTCQGCAYAPGVTQFPPDSIPLFRCTVVAGTFQPTGCIDLRATFSTNRIVAGAGVLITGTPGTVAVSIDPTLVSLHVLAPPKLSHDTCSTGQFSFDTDYYYICTAPNTWKRLALTSF